MPLRDITSMASHPKLPIVAYGNTSGYLFLLSLNEPERPSYLSKFYLTTYPIKIVKYSCTGQTIVAYTRDSNMFVVQVSFAVTAGVQLKIPNIGM